MFGFSKVNWNIPESNHILVSFVEIDDWVEYRHAVSMKTFLTRPQKIHTRDAGKREEIKNEREEEGFAYSLIMP